MRLISTLLLLMLAACGGGNSNTAPFGGTGGNGGGGGGGGGGGTTVTAANVVVQLSSATIPNTGTGTVNATFTALDTNGVAVAGATLAVAADSDAVLTITSVNGLKTDSAGQITATVGIGSNKTNRDITVSASTGSVTRTATLKVVNGTSGAVPSAIDIVASQTSVPSGGVGVTLLAFVKDANNNALPATPISFIADTGNLTNLSAVTDASGSGSATFLAGSDKSNRVATITVSSGVVSKQLTLPIVGTKLALSGPSSLIRGNTATFDVTVTDSQNNVVPNVMITAASSLGNTLLSGGTGSAKSDSSGLVHFTYTATNSGTDTLVFTGAGSSVSPSPKLVVSGQSFNFISPAPATKVDVNTAQTVQVQLTGASPLAGKQVDFAATGGTLSSSSATTDAAGNASVTLTSPSAGPVTVQATLRGSSTSTTLPLVIVATDPNRLVLQISPTAIAPNLGTGTGTTNQAQVMAKVTDPVGNPVEGLTVNFSRVKDPSGGTLSQVSATTNSGGVATVNFISGAQSTANNGVTLSASVASKPAVTDTAYLTVNQSALFIALGTGSEISNLTPETYKKDWVVYVTDANGIPQDGVTLTIKAIPTYYLTGALTYDGKVWVYDTVIGVKSCRNEDANGDGILDPGEDDNVDGVLWPGNVIGVTPGTVQTKNGVATISLIYAESYAPWVMVKLTASASVAGTESKNSAEFIVGGDATDFDNIAKPPAGATSPFGTLPKSGAVCN
jgi:hypothetical protein